MIRYVFSTVIPLTPCTLTFPVGIRPHLRITSAVMALFVAPVSQRAWKSTRVDMSASGLVNGATAQSVISSLASAGESRWNAKLLAPKFSIGFNV